MKPKIKIIITGGGTGGHVYPAIAIADAIKDIEPEAEILFIGAEDRLEMKAVPKAGYQIIGLPVKGLVRKLTLKNLKTIFLLFKSIKQAKKIFKEFKPQAVIGVGGYASAPALYIASKRKVPIFLQEQNSYPGITNRIFAKKAVVVFAAYEEVMNYIPAQKVKIVGNPVRKQILEVELTKEQALEKFGLQKDKKVLLVTGGSLGARTLNEAVFNNIDKLQQANIQLIWQTGRLYYDKYADKVSDYEWIRIMPFIDDMIAAYKASDLVIARAGAITISELSILGKPTIFVPSPNVAEDHQTKNAMALVEKEAALMVRDQVAIKMLISLAIETIHNDKLLEKLSKNIKAFAKPNAANDIAKFVLDYIKRFNN